MAQTRILCSVPRSLSNPHGTPLAFSSNPWAVGEQHQEPASGGKAKQSSLQVRDYKFCGACEERFNKGGEAWILNKIPQNYGDPFWLHTLLNSKTPLVNGNDLLFPQASIPE